jgi:DNA-binding transcriptional ArsR family regulator
MDVFAVLAEPTRREILARLQQSARSVNELAEALEISQPQASKHLKVLREAGFVVRTITGQQRIYELEPRLAPILRMWTKHLDALERHLDRKEKHDESRRLSPDPARGRDRGKRR